jgi:hypothetical protein
LVEFAGWSDILDRSHRHRVERVTLPDGTVWERIVTISTENE